MVIFSTAENSFKPMQETEVFEDGFLQSSKIISLVDFAFVFCTLLNYRKSANYKTDPRTRITCKKIRCYMLNSACRWLIVENAKYFEVKYGGLEVPQ